MSNNLPLAARVISEGFLPARSALLKGPGQSVGGPVAPDRTRGMLLGLAIGDALGNTSESLTAGDREAAFGEIRDYLPNRRAADSRVGLPSDDSQLAFWTLESLLEFGDMDPEDLAEKFTGREIFGVGGTVAKFLANRAEGVTPWYRCGVESAGNGALMRIAPIVLLHAEGPSAALWLNTALASIVTHRDACSVASCVAFADLLARLLRMPEPPAPGWINSTFVATVRQVCTDQPYRPRGGRFTDWEGPFPDYLEHVLGEATRHGWGTREACDALVLGRVSPRDRAERALDPRQARARSRRIDRPGRQRHQGQRHGRRDRGRRRRRAARGESIAAALEVRAPRTNASDGQRRGVSPGGSRGTTGVAGAIAPCAPASRPNRQTARGEGQRTLRSRLVAIRITRFCSIASAIRTGRIISRYFIALCSDMRDPCATAR